jgi:hypothetical protein
VLHRARVACGGWSPVAGLAGLDTIRGMRKLAALSMALGALISATALAAEVEITAGESIVRTAPFDVAPTLAHVHAGDRLTGEADAQNGWLRVSLPDGRNGFVHAGDARALPPPAAPAPPPLPAADSGEAQAPPALPLPAAIAGGQPTTVVVPISAPPSHRNGPTLLGMMFELLPVGSVELTQKGMTTTGDALVTVALAPFVDVPLSPAFELGASPQFVFKVKTSGDVGSATEYDLRARLTVRDPAATTARMFARVSPGYSILSLPAGALPDNTSSPAGFWVDFAVGSEIAVSPDSWLVVDLGYQIGLQGTTLPDGSNADFRTQFVHLGIGLAAGL